MTKKQKTVKMKFFEDLPDGSAKKGETINVSTKGEHHLAYIKMGIAEIIKEIPDKNIAKQILDKYRPMIVFSDAVFVKDGVSQVNSSKKYRYNPKKYTGKEVLMIAPKDCIRLEFEDSSEKNIRYIQEIEDSAIAKGYDYCITAHEGCKSPYFNMFNIKDMPLNEDNVLAKNLLIDSILPSGAKKQLDTSNFKWTLSPVIEHPHWKKKYNGAIHKIISGKNPIDHQNQYPKELLRLIKNSKKRNKTILLKTKQDEAWVEDFLLNYCTSHKLPAGQRHFVIEKNLAIFLIHRQDREDHLQKYLEAQGRTTNTLRTWFNAILKGEYSEVSAGELANFIKTNELEYIIFHGKQGTRETRATKATTDMQQIRIHGAGGIYGNLVVEPLGNYQYLYNFNGKKGITQMNYNPETKISTLIIEGDTFYFNSEPLKQCLFKIPSDESIKKYLDGDYPIKTTSELYQGMLNYLKVLYDLPGDFYYHIIAIGALQSWLIDALQVVFYLCFSAQFGAGKTAFLEGLSIVSHHGFLAGNISSSSVARISNKYKMSLFADELDVKAKGGDNETFLTFRQGYKRNNPYVRQKETSQGYTEEIIDVFGFKSYSVHSKSEDALGTRGIDIPLRISIDKTLPILNLFKDKIGFPLFEDIFFWYMDNASMLMVGTKATKATEKNTKATDSLLLFPSLPLFPGFWPGADGVCDIKKVRETLFKEFTKGFSDEELETLQKFMGRNEELLFVALLVCKVFGITRLGDLEHTFKQKVQNEGDDNIFITLLKEYLREVYDENCFNRELILSGGDHDGCFYYEKAKIYRGFRKKLKDEDFFPVGSDKFEEYLMFLNFNRGVNIKKERFKDSGKDRTKLALIFDEEAMASLELNKSKKDLDDYGKEPVIPDQKEDLKRFYKHVNINLDSKTCFDWDDELNNFVKNELEKPDPEFWINKQIENKVLEEPVLGKLRFLHDFGGDK